MTQNHKLDLKPFSIYLDFLRLAAACYVFVYHLKSKNIGNGHLLKLIPDLGHFAVILFFVLSGYLIAHTAHTHSHLGIRRFAISRLSRIYSVAIPALVLSLIFAKNYSDGTFKDEVFSILINLGFLGHSWFSSVNPFWNTPYWSLCYEVMYYVIFACSVFFSGLKRALLVLASLLIAGPKVLLLMPCWLLGALIYHLKDRVKINKLTAIFFAFLLPALLTGILYKTGFGFALNKLSEIILGDFYKYAGFSNKFITDLMVASIFATHIWAMRFIVTNFSWPVWLEKLLVEGAGMSFTLYLFHQPFIRLVDYYLPPNRSAITFFFSMLAIPALCYMLSFITEKRRKDFEDWLETHLPFQSKS